MVSILLVILLHVQIRIPLQKTELFQAALLRRVFKADLETPSPLRSGLPPHTTVCKLTHMPTNLAIDDDLLTEAQRVGGHRTKKDTVNEALKEYIQRRRQVKITDLFGTIEFEPTYDYKKQRRRS